MHLHSGLFAVAVISGVLVPRGVEAIPIVFTDRAAFEEAVDPNVLITFDGPFEFRGGNGNWAVDNTLLSLSTGFTIPSAPSGGAFNIFPFNGAQYSLLDGSPIYAIGMDISTAAASAHRVVAGDGFCCEQHTFMVSGPQFIGLLFSSPLSVGLNLDVFTTGQDFFTPLVVDNVSIRTAPVPEPATSLLMLSGALTLLQARRVMRRTKRA